MPPDRIETERLVLRRHDPSETDAIAAIWSDPRVVALDGKGATAGLGWRHVLHETDARAVFGAWAIEDRTDATLLGEIGLADLGRDTDPPLVSDAEIGWVLVPDRWGLGLATEAATAVLAWADATAHLRVLQLLIGFENEASLRLAAKLGFAETGTIWFRDRQSVVLTRSRA